MGATPTYSLPYPEDLDPVDVAGDIRDLAESVENVLEIKAPLASPALTGSPTTTTAAADDSSTRIASTAFVVGQASNSLPTMSASAAGIGSSLKYARADHVHPSDSTKADTSFVTSNYVSLTGTQTVTNKTLSSPVIVSASANSGTFNSPVIISASANFGTFNNSTMNVPTLYTPNILNGSMTAASVITVTGVQTLAAYRVRNIYVSTSTPTTGNEGDIWLKY